MEGLRLSLSSLWLLGLVALAPLAGGHTCVGSTRALIDSPRPPDGANNELGCGESIYHKKPFPSLRINEGWIVRPGELPFMAHFNKRTCVGTIIDEKHLLTSATCTDQVDENNLTVYIGCHKGKESCIAKRISKVMAHEHYHLRDNRTRDAYNLALLRTETPMEFKLTRNGLGSVNRVCLPDRDDKYESVDVTIAGWGKPVDSEGKERHEGPEMNSDVYIESSKPCALALQSKFHPNISSLVYTPGQQICVVGSDEFVKRSTCGPGDLGGPLLGQMKGTYEIVGVLARDVYCRNDLFPNLFTRVSAFLDWIEWAKRRMEE